MDTELPTPTPPETTNAPEVVPGEAVLLCIVTVEPINAFPLIPTPPLITKEPVVVAVEF